MKITRSYEAKSKWADIAKQIASGNNGYLNVGDTIGCTLKNGTEVVLEVLALDPYQQNSIVLCFKDILWQYRWNERNTNSGGWRDCEMRRYFNDELLKLLPDELVEVIVPRKIIQRLRGAELESLDKLWALSYTEVFGADRGTDQTGDVGDVQFEFFQNKKNRVKFFRGEPYYHALRSPYATVSTGFWLVNGNGSMVHGSAYGSGGVCPCFIISQP